MKNKLAYRIRNWKSYNRALIHRGNLTLWVSEDAIQSWYAARPSQSGRGRPFTYSDACIELALTLRSLFGFPLRSTQGFLEGLMQMMKLNLKVPHYSLLSRRADQLKIQLPRQQKDGALDLVIDSTGLKVFGEGEWKIRTHGKQNRRTWRKYHVAVDPHTHEVVALKLTRSKVHDGTMMKRLLTESTKDQTHLGNVYGDGAYDQLSCYDAIAEGSGKPVIPLRAGSAIMRAKTGEALSAGKELRNQLIRDKRAAGGKKAWKQSSGYHRRSLVETHMFRLKTILGGKLRSRDFRTQKVEAAIMASILNRMTALGMPESFIPESFVK